MEITLLQHMTTSSTSCRRKCLARSNCPANVRQASEDDGSFYAHQQVSATDGGSGVVVAGMGESDLFPIVLHYRVGSIAAGKLRYVKSERHTSDPSMTTQ